MADEKSGFLAPAQSEEWPDSLLSSSALPTILSSDGESSEDNSRFSLFAEKSTRENMWISNRFLNAESFRSSINDSLLTDDMRSVSILSVDGDTLKTHERSTRGSWFGSQSTLQNVWISNRYVGAESIRDVVARVVPSLLKDNVRLFIDPKLGKYEDGKLYMREDVMNERTYDPEYALSVNPTIYQQMMDEINDSKALPLGLYFCCRGGDGAYIGVSHDDYVEIYVAWIIVFAFFASVAVILMLTPEN